MSRANAIELAAIRTGSPAVGLGSDWRQVRAIKISMNLISVRDRRRTEEFVMRFVKPLARTAVALLIGGVLVVIGPIGPAAAASCTGRNVSDFNGDGISDVAVSDGDTFHVIYGHGTHLNATTPQDQLFTAPSAAVGYGATLAAGDFNGDGCTDLAVAYTADRSSFSLGHGAVAIFLGHPSGLKYSGLTLAPDATLDANFFGYAMGVGDLNGDGKPDLVVGEPGENAAWAFLGGTPTGVHATGTKVVEGHGGVPGGDQPLDFFGQTIAVGDFNGDGHDDVAIGAPYEDNGSGRVYVLRGGSTSTPLSITGIKVWSQNSPGVPGTVEQGDNFGGALAAGHFKSDFGTADLAIGAPGESLPGGPSGAGIVDVLFSTASTGLTGTGAQEWSQASTGVPGTPEINGAFGSVLAAADFNGDLKDDLAVGQPSATVNSQYQAGAVTVLYGESSGLDPHGVQRFTESTAGVPGSPEANDNFGGALATVRITNDNRYDLVVGVPGESFGTLSAGAMELIPSVGTTGLSGIGTTLWDAGTAGIKGAGCDNCEFGYSIA
jgi:hypothetical protein